MKILKYCLLILGVFFHFNIVVGLNRDSLEEHYCDIHLEKYHSIKYPLIKEYIHLIPHVPKTCFHVDCSLCHHVFVTLLSCYGKSEGDYDWAFGWECACVFDFKTPDDGCFNWRNTWSECLNKSIYPGYLNNYYTKYTCNLLEYLSYVDSNRSCRCFWPEISKNAANISDKAYLLFEKLFENTDLIALEDKNLQKEFFLSIPYEGFSLHGIVNSCINHCFFYSDYLFVCEDIEFYSKSHFNDKSFYVIKNSLDEIKEKLALLFLDLYTNCFNKHPNDKIKKQLYLVKNQLNISLFDEDWILFDEFLKFNELNGQISWEENYKIPFTTTKYQSKDGKLRKEVCSTTYDIEIPSPQDNYVLSNVFLAHGIFYNDLNLYDESIKNLTQSIFLNPMNSEAYAERAKAYFETNQLALALLDFNKAKESEFIPPFKSESQTLLPTQAMGMYVPENKIDFAQGLTIGALEGSQIAAFEFVPSIFSSFRGISKGLWAFVCSPVEISKELAYTAYGIGEFISTHSAEECFKCAVPELRELSVMWSDLNDHHRGRKIGYIIGKYGVDIFLPVGAVKGINKVRALNRANTMLTLESCAISNGKQNRILEESSKIAARRTALIEASKGKILIKNSNVQYHIMQPRHEWGRLLSLTGDAEIDFRSVKLLLEEANILSKDCQLRSKVFAEGKIIRADYRKTIEGQTVQAVFETYLETNETFLQDAWVISK